MGIAPRWFVTFAVLFSAIIHSIKMCAARLSPIGYIMRWRERERERQRLFTAGVCVCIHDAVSHPSLSPRALQLNLIDLNKVWYVEYRALEREQLSS